MFAYVLFYFWGVFEPHLHNFGKTQVSLIQYGAVFARHDTGRIIYPGRGNKRRYSSKILVHKHVQALIRASHLFLFLVYIVPSLHIPPPESYSMNNASPNPPLKYFTKNMTYPPPPLITSLFP